MLKTKIISKDKDFTVVEVGLAKTSKNKCEKCGKKNKGMSDCPNCGKTLCNDCADWTVALKKIVCAECAALMKKNKPIQPGIDNVLMSSPTRSGKGVSSVMSTLLSYPESAIVLDFKGESLPPKGGS